MARTAVTVTTLSGTAETAEPAGTTADPTNDHVISGVPLEELIVRLANTNGSDRVATIVAGDNPRRSPPARGTSPSLWPPPPASSGSARSIPAGSPSPTATCTSTSPVRSPARSPPTASRGSEMGPVPGRGGQRMTTVTVRYEGGSESLVDVPPKARRPAPCSTSPLRAAGTRSSTTRRRPLWPPLTSTTIARPTQRPRPNGWPTRPRRAPQRTSWPRPPRPNSSSSTGPDVFWLPRVRAMRSLAGRVAAPWRSSEQVVDAGQHGPTIGMEVLVVHQAAKPGQLGACPTRSRLVEHYGHRYGRIIRHTREATS